MEQEKFNWKRLLITIVIVLVTAGAVGGAVWYVMGMQAKEDKGALEQRIEALEVSKKVDEEKVTDKAEVPPPEWKTYSGNGVSFKYPTDWKFAETKTDYSSMVSFTAPNNDSMVFEVNPGGRGLQGVRLFVTYSVSVTGDGISVTRKSSNESEDMAGTPSEGYAVITESNNNFSKNGNAYQFILTGKNYLNAVSAEETLKKIASTFKFSGGN